MTYDPSSRQPGEGTDPSETGGGDESPASSSAMPAGGDSTQPPAGGEPEAPSGMTQPISPEPMTPPGWYTPPAESTTPSTTDQFQSPGSYTPPPTGAYMPPPPTGGEAQPPSSYTPPPSGGNYTQPISPGEGAGGYTPPSGPSYTQPMGMSSSEGPGGPPGYTPPPEGGYTPPPPGGYAPPPGGEEGYTPPPSGGYTPPPPPPGGAYGGPPPMGGAGAPVAAGAGPNDFGHLLQSYMNAVARPNVETYAGEIRNASWAKVVIGLGIVAVVSLIMSFITSATNQASMEQISNMFGSSVDPDILEAASASSNPFFAFIAPFITFFLGSLLLYVLARMLGGQGSDFMSHSYLLSISYTPTRVVASVVQIIPCIGLIVAIVLYLYQIYCAGLAIQAGHRMEAGRAQMAAWLGFAIILVLACLGAILCAGMLAAMIASIAGSTNP